MKAYNFNIIFIISFFVFISNPILGQKGLYKAIEENDLSMFKTNLIKYSVSSLNSKRPSDKFTPLMYACSQGDLPIIKYILTKKNNYYQRDKDGNTPLLIALKYDQFNVASYLLDIKKEDIHTVNDNNENVIMNTCIRSPYRNIKENTLIDSIEQQRIYMFKRFFKEGVSLNALTEEGNSTLIYAAYSGNFTLFHEIFTNGDKSLLKKINKYKSTLLDEVLNAAVIGGNLKILKFMYELGSSLDAKDDNRNTPIMNAIYLENWDIINFLLEKEIDLNYVNPFDYSALTIAIMIDDYNLAVELLETTRQEIDLTTDYGNLLFICSKTMGNEKIDSILLSNEINFNGIKKDLILADSISKVDDVESSIPIYNESYEKIISLIKHFDKKMWTLRDRADIIKTEGITTEAGRIDDNISFADFGFYSLQKVIYLMEKPETLLIIADGYENIIYRLIILEDVINSKI